MQLNELLKEDEIEHCIFPKYCIFSKRENIGLIANHKLDPNPQTPPCFHKRSDSFMVPYLYHCMAKAQTIDIIKGQL